MKPRVPPLLLEIIVGGFWMASAVQVGGYTWAAVKSTWSALPDGSGGSGSTAPAIPLNSTAEGKKVADNAVSKIPLIGPALVAAGGWLQGIANGGVGPQSLSASQISRLQRLAPVPTGITRNLRGSKPGQGQANAANALAKWALANGWKASDVNAYLQYLGIQVGF